MVSLPRRGTAIARKLSAFARRAAERGAFGTALRALDMAGDDLGIAGLAVMLKVGA